MKTPCTIVCMIVAGIAVAAEPVPRPHFPKDGLTFAPLETAGHKGPLVLIMALPDEDGFAANVEVRIQQFEGTMEEYAALSSKQLDAAGMEVISAKTVDGERFWEYTGRVEGRELHCYAKAVRQKNGVVLFTATAGENQWNELSARLKACVDNFWTD